MSRLALPVATAGYVGLAPVAPGTWGSAVGLCLLLLVRLTGEAGAEALLLGVVLAVGVWSATVAERLAKIALEPGFTWEKVPVFWANGPARLPATLVPRQA